jgi:hypothetical protein
MTPIRLSKNWQLFLDHHLVERETGLTRRMHHPEKCGVVLPADQPWEHSVLFAYPIWDGQLFHALYRAKWFDPEIADLYDGGARQDKGHSLFAYEYA